jgi:hypothetical protein
LSDSGPAGSFTLREGRPEREKGNYLRRRRIRMKKVFLVILVVFFATALYAGTKVDPESIYGTTYSQAWRERQDKTFGTPLMQFDLSGEFNAEGLYWKNKGLNSSDTFDTAYYRGYLNLFPKLKIENATVITKISMVHQEPWAQFAGTDNIDAASDLVNTTSKNENIAVERAYLHYDFAGTPGLFTEVGLMDGAWWGTTFADNMQGRWRVKLQHNKTPVGVVGALLEKDAEVGDTAGKVEDSEKDDYDAYAIYGVTKVGDVMIEPLIFYVHNSAFNRSAPGAGPGGTDVLLTGLDHGSNGIDIWYYALAFEGKLGPLGFEAELGLKDYTSEIIQHVFLPGTTTDAVPASTIKNDYQEWGAYLNLWNNMDFGRLGGILAYGNWDDKGGPTKTGSGFDFRSDFKSNLILGDELGFGSATAEDLVGMTLIKPYVKEIKLMDKLTCSASFAYIMSNQEDSKYEDATAWEGDAGVQYKLADNVAYFVDLGYANISFDSKGRPFGAPSEDPDPIWLLKHQILFTF